MRMPTPPSPLKLILSTLSFLAWPALILFLAGDWRWPEGWIFGGWFVAMSVSIIAWLYRHDPALLAERYRRPGTGGQSRRDTLIVYLVMLGFIAWIVLMPLDARRFHWTPPLPLTLKVGGGAATYRRIRIPGMIWWTSVQRNNPPGTGATTLISNAAIS